MRQEGAGQRIPQPSAVLAGSEGVLTEGAVQRRCDHADGEPTPAAAKSRWVETASHASHAGMLTTALAAALDNPTELPRETPDEDVPSAASALERHTFPVPRVSAGPPHSGRCFNGVVRPRLEITAADAVELLDLLEGHGIDVWVDGGWCVDALAGRQTRPHDDLDIVVRTDQVDALWSVLLECGFAHSPAADDSEWNFVATDSGGRSLDVHAVTFAKNGYALYGPPGPEETGWPSGSLDGHGVIAGRAVRCTTAEERLASLSGYELDEDDRSDIAVLSELIARSEQPGRPPAR